MTMGQAALRRGDFDDDLRAALIQARICDQARRRYRPEGEVLSSPAGPRERNPMGGRCTGQKRSAPIPCCTPSEDTRGEPPLSSSGARE
jgi:hypothetical protein